MKTRRLSEVLERVEAWPDEAQDRLAEIAVEIEAGLSGAVYEPTDEELAGIDRGLRDAEQGRFATDAEVEAVLAKLRGDEGRLGRRSAPRSRGNNGLRACALPFVRSCT